LVDICAQLCRGLHPAQLITLQPVLHALVTLSEDPRDAVESAHSLVYVEKVGAEGSDSGCHGRRMDASRYSKACWKGVA
jgi:hypothetical protein